MTTSFSSPSPTKVQLSYCIPVLNRSSEVLTTLQHNLLVNKPSASEVEFIVAIFDRSDDLRDHLFSLYSTEIDAGFLRIIRIDGLDSWHFGKAKNSFRGHIRGRMYSSLDADNFVTPEETELTLGLIRRYEGRCIVHHFRGQWGDGTCGRVTAPVSVYESIGYDDTFMPRQYDEMDFLLSAVVQHPSLPYITYFPGGALEQSGATRTFLRDEGIKMNNQVVAPPPAHPPLGQRGDGYIKTDKKLSLMLEFNQSSSYAKNTSDASRRDSYVEMAREAANKLVDDVEAPDLQELFFHPGALPNGHLPPRAIPVFAVMKNEQHIIDEWYAHYKALGCGPFIIADNGSRPSIAEILREQDVFAASTKVGSYKTCRSAWLRALMKIANCDGRWVVTTDADEFLEVPKTLAKNIVELAEHADRDGRIFVPGLLVDMLPKNYREVHDIENNPIVEIFSHHFWGRRDLPLTYVRHPSIVWGFGKHWRLSYRVDLRYRAWGAINSLRKLPLIRVAPGMRLNQGFHDIRLPPLRRGQSSEELWGRSPILPIKHFKLAELYSAPGIERLRAKARQSEGYHLRAAEGMARMVETPLLTSLDRIPASEFVMFDVLRFQRPAPPGFVDTALYRLGKALTWIQRLARRPLGTRS